MKLFNLFRYVASAIIPTVCLFAVGWWCVLISSILLLYINNVIDDIVFYYGSCFVKKINTEGVVSPVEGVVTNIEYNASLYSHLEKRDILTKTKLVDASIAEKDGRYAHITIFLNKLNKHLVANMFGTESTINQYTKDGEMLPMVEDGMLVSDNKGEYLDNTFIDITYSNGVHVVLTMDKYISKAVTPSSRVDVEMLICRGSQCDIYIPNCSQNFAVRLNQKVDVLEPIIDASFCVSSLGDKEGYRSAVLECIKSSGFSTSCSFLDNIYKTICTVSYNRLFLLVVMLLVCMLPKYAVLAFSVYIYLYAFARFYKNTMYSLMNIIGYKNWMTVSYNKLHKAINYGNK